MALGRAIVREPSAFLMDEPLSNLDAKLRVQTRAEILKLQERLETTTIYVTHDQVEAMTMGDRIAVMNLGVLQQVGTPEQLYEQPANLFVASFIGSPPMNLVPATALGVGGTDRVAGFRPENVQLGNGSGDPVRFRGVVDVVEYLGDEQLVHISLGDHALVAKLPVGPKLDHNAEFDFSILDGMAGTEVATALAHNCAFSPAERQALMEAPSLREIQDLLLLLMSGPGPLPSFDRPPLPVC